MGLTDLRAEPLPASSAAQSAASSDAHPTMQAVAIRREKGPSSMKASQSVSIGRVKLPCENDEGTSGKSA